MQKVSILPPRPIKYYMGWKTVRDQIETMPYVLAWLLVCFVLSSEASVQRRDKTSTNYNALVCELQENETLRSMFYAGVRQQYGMESNDYGKDIDKNQ